MNGTAAIGAPGLLADITPLDEHNRVLLENAHPPDWRNPAPAGRYNLIVIGAGTAGLVTAAGAAALGARVALVERRLMGGDCLNFGCVPSKALIRSGRGAAAVGRARELGVEVPCDPRVDFAAVMERVRRLRARISPSDSARRFAGLGVDVFLGEARFAGPDRIAVDGTTLRFARACIATGASPAAPAIPGLAEAGFHTNETIFTLTELPRRLAVVGGGPIGCELAQAFARLGSRVHLLEREHGILTREDRDAAEIIRGALAADGVEITAGCRVREVRRGDGRVVTFEAGGACRDLEVDEVLAGVGRAPNVEGLGLEVAGVGYDRREGVRVDDHLRTSNPRIYAAGDCCSRFKFTHAAEAMARIVVKNALFFGRARASGLVIPWCTYTDPEIAHVGLYEHEARERGIEVHTIRVSLGDVDRAILDGEESGFLKVHLKKGSDRILGATLVAAHAGEVISEITAVMGAGGGLREIDRAIHCYPTQAEAIKRAAGEWSRSRLTPRVKWLTERALAWRR